MKLIIYFIAVCLPIFSLSGYAEECPATLNPSQIPAGWIVTYKGQLSQPVVSLYWAFYNGNHNSSGEPVIPNGRHISCDYYDNNENNYIEIMTNQGDYAQPDGKAHPAWTLSGGGDNILGWCNVLGNPVSPDQCPFSR